MTFLLGSVLNLQSHSKLFLYKNIGTGFSKLEIKFNDAPIHIILNFLFFFDKYSASISCFGVGRVIKISSFSFILGI